MQLPFFKSTKAANPTTKASQIGGLLALTGLTRAKWTSRRYDTQIEEGYRKNVVVWRCVTMVAEALASIPFTLYDGRGRIVQNHPVQKLLARPNPTMAGADFFAAIATTWQLAGNVFIEAVRPEADSPPTELYLLRPDRMKVLPGPSGLPLGYEYAVNGKAHTWRAHAITGACDVLHWKNFNPLDDWYGMSPLEAALMSVDQHNAASTWNQALLGQAARPSGALVYAPREGPQTLSTEQLQRLREEFDTSYSGARNAGRPLILEGGLEWKALALSPQEMEWLKGRDAAARDIALAFGVPAQLVGIPDTQTYNNMQEARLALYEETVMPLATRLQAALNSWLLPMFGGRTQNGQGQTGLRFAIDADEISALVPRREKLWDKVNSANFLTVNEKRDALGYPPVSGGDLL